MTRNSNNQQIVLGLVILAIAVIVAAVRLKQGNLLSSYSSAGVFVMAALGLSLVVFHPNKASCDGVDCERETQADTRRPVIKSILQAVPSNLLIALVACLLVVCVLLEAFWISVARIGVMHVVVAVAIVAGTYALISLIGRQEGDAQRALPVESFAIDKRWLAITGITFAASVLAFAYYCLWKRTAGAALPLGIMVVVMALPFAHALYYQLKRR